MPHVFFCFLGHCVSWYNNSIILLCYRYYDVTSLDFHDAYDYDLRRLLMPSGTDRQTHQHFRKMHLAKKPGLKCNLKAPQFFLQENF